MRRSRSLAEHQTEILDLFFGDIRPLPNDVLLVILSLAGLARCRRKLVVYRLYFPRLVTRIKKHDKVATASDERVSPQ